MGGDILLAGRSYEVDEVLRKIEASLMVGGSYRFLANTSVKIRYSISALPISKTGNLVNDTVSFLLVFHL